MCWVAASICVTDAFTSSMPAVCSRDARLMSAMIAFTLPTAFRISSIVVPARDTSALPSRTLRLDAAISSWISFAAAAERCARCRTSLATTAKPRPCSPARAASTAAFSARMLVWNAMLSITPTMPTMRVELSEIASIVRTTSRTTSPPRDAMSDARVASALASCALSAFWRTVAVSCSMLAAACCSDAACWPARIDRSRLPPAIARASCMIASVPCRTCRTTATSPSRIPFSAFSRRSISLPRPDSTVPVRSPAAIRANESTAASIGVTIARVSARCANTPAISATSPAMPNAHSVMRKRPAACSKRAR